MYFENKIHHLFNRTIELGDIEQLFVPFGEISKILIYDRVEQVRAFVEFVEPVRLKAVQNFIHGKTYNDMGLIYVN